VSQNLEALAVANGLRLAGAELRRGLRQMPSREGARTAAVWIRTPTAAIGSMNIERLLTSVQRLGPHRAAAMLAASRITKVQKVREVTPGRRELLSRLLDEWADGFVARRSA
jgi:hypothetical protein